MKSLASAVLLLGIVGLVLNLALFLRTVRGPGHVPFSYEAFGGPGPLLGALVLVLVGLYLRSLPQER